MSDTTDSDSDLAFASDAPRADSMDQRRTAEAVASALFGLGDAVKVGRFSLLERCGSGAMGIVYSAWDPRLGRKVAIKVLRESGDEVGRILREARAAASLGHPNTVTVYDAGEDGGRSYIAMEFIDGSTLGPWLDAKTRSEADIRDVFTQLARGLHAAHAAGLIHRDFKPANVMVSRRDGRNVAQVLDFGLTIAAEESSEVGRIAGTPAYMAPELRLGDPPTAASDQYAFFIALYEALTGARPKTRPAPVERIPRSLRALVQRGLHQDPTERHSSMEEVAEALTPQRSRLSLWAMGAAATAVVVGVSMRGPESVVDPCAQTEQAWTEAVNPPAIEDARFQAALETYRQDWVDARSSVCAATFHRGVQSQDLLEVRNTCLQSAAFAAGALAESVAADPAKSARALAAVAGLPSPRDCARAEGSPDAPSEPLERALADLGAQLGLLEWDAAAARARAMAAQPKGSASQEVRRYLLTSTALERTDARAEAAALLDAAAQLAITQDQPAAAAAVAVEKIWMLGVRGHDLDAAREWEQLGQAWLEAAGLAGGITSARLRDRLGRTAALVNAVEESQELHREALEIAIAAVGESAPATVPFRVHLHGVLRRNGDEARALREQTRPLIERDYGPDHPILAVLLGGGRISFERPGECEDAVADFEEALRIKSAHYGPNALDVTPPLTSLANCQALAGDLRGAAASLRRAVQIRESHEGSDSPGLYAAMFSLAIAEMAASEHRLAFEHAERALALRTAALKPEHPQLFGPTLLVAMALDRLGRSNEALAGFAEALALEDPAVTDPYDRVEARLEYGRALGRVGRADASARMYAEAATIAETVQDPAVRALFDDFERTPAPPG
jgi:tetratricopeptide (TPR) repeat protein